jgi:DNA-directed RNA polymerase specialized sigma24 family protein
VQAVVTEEIRPADQADTEQFLALVREYDLRHRRLAYRLLGDRDRMDDAL